MSFEWMVMSLSVHYVNHFWRKKLIFLHCIIFSWMHLLPLGWHVTLFVCQIKCHIFCKCRKFWGTAPTQSAVATWTFRSVNRRKYENPSKPRQGREYMRAHWVVYHLGRNHPSRRWTVIIDGTIITEITTKIELFILRVQKSSHIRC